MVAVDLQPYFVAEAKERQRAAGGNHNRESASGKNSGSAPDAKSNGEAREKVAGLVHVNSHYISDAKRIKEASPQLAEQVRDGRISLPDAKKVLNEQQQQMTGTEGRIEGATPSKPSCSGSVSSGQRKGEELVLKSTTKETAIAAKLVKFYGQPRAAAILAALTDLVVSSTGEDK